MIYKVATPTGPVDVPELYAITDVKEYAKSFELTRNMDYFKCKKTNVSKKDYYKFLEKNGRLIMGSNIYVTKKDVLSIQRSTNVAIIGPRSEDSSVFIKSEKISDMLGSSTDGMVRCLDDKYLKLLSQFKYFDFIAYHPSTRMDPFFEGTIGKGSMFTTFLDEDTRPDWMIDNNIKYDTLAIFLTLHGWTMKVKQTNK